MLYQKSLMELAAGLARREYSAVELTTAFLQRIETLNPRLNAFITIDPESALKAAQKADQQRLSATSIPVHPLMGIPLAHKDIFCTQGVKTTCGSKMLGNFIPPYNATVIERCEAAGLISLGKTNMDEFAMGSSNETSFFGAVNNPWDLTRVPGGSSGGSAAAVAAYLVPAATATDTGGSIRQPAAFCGITGIKPTYGRVSRYGMVAFASSLDQGGILTRTAQDAAWMLEILSGFDPKDSTSINAPVPHYSKLIEGSIRGLRIGLPKAFFSADLDPAIADHIQAALMILEQQGAILKTIDLPHLHLSIPVYYVVAPAECSSNLARFDGVRYGYRCENPMNLEDLYKRSRTEGFGAEVQRRLLIGTYVLSSGYYDAYYKKAQQIRQLISTEFTEAFKEVDIIAGPTVPNTAFKKGEKSADPISMYLNDLYTGGVNLAGLPGLSIPAGFVDGLPVGLQLIGNTLDEARILQAAHQFQQHTDWHLRMPSGISIH
jgi:aspartyl-tRNA(Asn)/glutamyl-tRNA(Gln) amidotransferase subunit A